MIKKFRLWSHYNFGGKYKCLCFHMCHWRTVQEFDASQRKLRCDKCGRYWGMHDGASAILPWDDDLEQMHANTFGFGRTIK